MARKPRVVIPENPAELMKLTGLIYAQHQKLGAKSPLSILGSPTWDEQGPEVQKALAAQSRIGELERELKDLYGQRDPHLDTFTDLDRRSRDILLVSTPPTPPPSAATASTCGSRVRRRVGQGGQVSAAFGRQLERPGRLGRGVLRGSNTFEGKPLLIFYALLPEVWDLAVTAYRPRGPGPTHLVGAFEGSRIHVARRGHHPGGRGRPEGQRRRCKG